MAELLFQLRTAHGAMSSQPELPVLEGLAGMEDLPPGWVIYIHRLQSALGRWLQCLIFSLVSSEQVVFQNRIVCLFNVLVKPGFWKDENTRRWGQLQPVCSLPPQGFIFLADK